MTELIRNSIVRCPGAVAVDGATTTSYADLAALAADCASLLRSRGVRPGSRVGLAIPRSTEMIAALMAIWECGAASVPLPAEATGERITRLIDDCEARCLVVIDTAHGVDDPRRVVWTPGAGASDAGSAPPVGITPADTAYVIYTSGSTGVPKGVVMSHRAFANVVGWQVRSTASTHGEQAPRVLQFTPLTFDVAYLEIFACLAAGGTLLLPTEEQRRDPAVLFRLMAEMRATSVFLPHVMLHAVADVAADVCAGQQLRLRQLLTGGEQMIVTDRLRSWMRSTPGCVVQNIYGPTETHVVTSYELTGDPDTWPQRPPIGRAVPGATFHILGADRTPVSAGAVGELYISGPCVADGYLGLPEVTGQRFLTEPETGAPMYRSGDLVTDLGDGVLQYVGRVDNQIKIRGAVADPSGVEAVLAEHPDVKACAVVAREEARGEKHLVAYVVAESAAGVSVTGEPVTRQADPVLMRHLLDRLPEWSVPDTYVFLTELPVSPSGKIDRQALPAPSRTRPPTAGPRIAPTTATEARLVEIWSRLLRLDDIGTTDKFFELGGHSLLLTRLQAELNNAFAREIRIADLIELPTIQDLAPYLDEATGPEDVKYDPKSGANRRAAFRDRGRQRRTKNDDH